MRGWEDVTCTAGERHVQGTDVPPSGDAVVPHLDSIQLYAFPPPPQRVHGPAMGVFFDSITLQEDTHGC
jgi:hypothetical protein